ncbi:hypothetical protein A2U01_0035201, partial [Trifolium medium]|nr:hypothetical protein [Trifolium medium]
KDTLSLFFIPSRISKTFKFHLSSPVVAPLKFHYMSSSFAACCSVQSLLVAPFKFNYLPSSFAACCSVATLLFVALSSLRHLWFCHAAAGTIMLMLFNLSISRSSNWECKST